MKTLKLHQIATLALSLLFGATAMAAPTSGPYVTDPQHEYVQDATSEAIGTVNMVLCIVNAMNITESGMLNVGPYIALIDMNKCQSKGGSSSSSSSSSGASAAVNYMTAVVDATRANVTSPMIANVWMSMTEEGRNQNIYVKLTATTSPTDAPPYGVFRLDFAGEDDSGNLQMNGFIDSSSGSLQYYETGTTSSNIALTMTAPDTTSGSGTLTSSGHGPSPTAVTYDFNYNPTHFRRRDDTGLNDRCFNRLKAQADRSVWRYGTYNNSDGTRVDQANPSFQITATYGGNSYYGYAGYWGIGFQGLNLNNITDANPIPLLDVRDQRPGNNATYSLSKIKGKLTKWEQVPTDLNAMNGIPFFFYGDLTSKTSDTTNIVGWGNWQMQWNNTVGTAGNFTVTGKQTCGGNSCNLTTFSPATVISGAFNNLPISGWSDSFGGSINIPASITDHINTNPVSYFRQSTVIPGSPSTPTTLYCLSNCPDANSVTAANDFVTGGTAVVPFRAATTTQWFSAPTGSTVSYTYGSNGLVEGITPMIINNADFFAPGSNYQYGVMSGRLFETDFTPCGTGMVCEQSNPGVYYTWSTSTDQWNQTMWLTATGSTTPVAFAPPQNISYLVTEGPWAGKTIQLQFNGFGNLGGIPGYCVNPVNNVEAPCSQDTRYVPLFSIPNGATMTLDGTTLIVKALEAELRLKDIGAGAAVCPTLALTTQTPPTSGAHDVSPGGAYYIGAKPTVTTAPKVIDGVVQY